MSGAQLGWGKKLLFTSAIGIACLLVLELGTRITFAFIVGPKVLLFGTSEVRKSQNHTVDYLTHEADRYRKFRPNEELVDHPPGRRGSFPVRINASGFRGQDFTTHKPRGVVRVLTLGSSSTFGYGNRDDETYPYYLERELNAACPGSRFQVLNMGIPHLRSEEIVALFLAEGVALDPDVVTFYEGANDAAARKARAQIGRLSLFGVTPRDVRDHIMVFALLDSWYKSAAIERSSEQLEAMTRERRASFLDNLETLRQETARREILFLPMTQQSRSGILTGPELAGVRYDEEREMIAHKLERDGFLVGIEGTFLIHTRLMAGLREWASRKELPLVDVVEALDGDRDKLTSWVHLNPQANRIIAAAVAPAILARTCAQEAASWRR